MKQGRTLTDLAHEIERQNAVKADYLADTRSLEFRSNGSSHIHLKADENSSLDFQVKDVCHNQIAERVGIPQKYYDRLRADAPGLLDANVNHWFQSKPETRMVRTLDGGARAFLSDRYRPLDNYDLCEAILPVFADKGVEVVSCEVTEKRLYIKAVNPKIEEAIKVGDVVQAGITVSNSEIGFGALAVDPMVYRLICENGMSSADHRMRKYHVGKTESGEEGFWEYLKDRTKQAADQAFWLKVRDLVSASLEQALFQTIVNKLKDAVDAKIDADPVRFVEVVAKNYSLNDGERGGVLKHLIEGSDLSLYGLQNAVTRHSQDVPDYDRATELEKLGGRLIELSRKDWSVINEQAQ